VRKERLDSVDAFTTKDGSEIRELAGTPTGNAVNQSLAEATVPPGAETEEHYHRASEEIYLFTSGSGRMKLGDDEAEVAAGDTVVIPPGTPHKLWNTTRSSRADRVLHFLKCWNRASTTGLAGASTAT
jgi:mannose-6-phosphate isomerase-like protein (cupin superfamily)